MKAEGRLFTLGLFTYSPSSGFIRWVEIAQAVDN